MYKATVEMQKLQVTVAYLKLHDIKKMQFQLIRSATIRFEYANKIFIIDPNLAAKHTRPSYTGTSANPLVDLSCSPQEAKEENSNDLVECEKLLNLTISIISNDFVV